MSASENRFRRALEGLLGVPATEGNRVDVLRNGDEIFPAMIESIEAAEHTIDFLTFVYWDGRIGAEFASRLATRAREGVRVRVLLDAFGASRINKDWVQQMDEAGVHVAWFRPLQRFKPTEVNHRTHRKVLICDEQVAYTGGVGIADEWCGDARDETEWRDTHFRVTGPAVDGLRAAFVDNWAETGALQFDPDIDRFPDQDAVGDAVVQVVRGAAETGWSDVTTLVRTLLRLAEDRVRIATAYFSPDDHTLELLCETAKRGVDVELLLPGPHIDKRFCAVAAEDEYETLLEAGVQIYCFQPSMLHAKIMLVDDTVANVGSSNFNQRSLNLDEEVNLVVIDSEVVTTLDGHFDEDLGRSEAIDPEQWAERGVTRKLLEGASNLFSSEL